MLRLVQEGAGPRPFDVTARRLIEADPEGWLSWIGLPPDGPVEPIESDVSTVLAEVDKVLRVDGPTQWLAHVEVQASHDPLLPLRLLQYHALLLYRHRQPVASTVVLLRPEADGAELTGRFEGIGPGGTVAITLEYIVVRLWERPVEELLGGGIGIAPLAPLAAVAESRVPEVIDRLRERFGGDVPPDQTRELWAATTLLLGLRYDENEAQELVRGIRGMRESSTYQAILREGREEGREEGRVEGARRLLLRLGTSKLGPPDPRTASRLEAIDDLVVLERLSDGLFAATSWDQLLAEVA
jgi:hypothetical protein